MTENRRHAKDVIAVADGAHQKAELMGTMKKVPYIILFLAADGMMLYGLATLAAALIHW
jgi:hypothetical protein